MRRVLVAVVVAALAAAGGLGASLAPSGSDAARPKPAIGIHKIKHVIVIMQENRSFDQYFGTYPGRRRLPAAVPTAASTVCCRTRPRRVATSLSTTTRDLNSGGPHGQANATADINGGKMDGFVASAENAKRKGAKRSEQPDLLLTCDNARRDGVPRRPGHPELLGIRANFVLQDHMFEPNASWSLPAHLFMVSEWSAKCTNANDPFSCTNALQSPVPHPTRRQSRPNSAEVRVDRPHLSSAQATG